MLLYAGSILASVLAFVGFIQALHWAQLRGADTYAVASINYSLSAIVFLFWFLQATIPVETSVVIAGMICGVIYAVCFFLLLYCMHWVGVGRTATTINLAPVLTIIISVFVWDEIPTILTTIGIITAAVSIPLILIAKSKDKKQLHFIGVIALAGLFTVEGLINTIFKWFERLQLPQQRLVFLTATFIVAAIVTLTITLRRGLIIRKIDVIHGVVASMFSVVANIMFLYCLTLAAAGIILTTITASSLIMVSLTSVLLWHERYSGKTVLGLVLAVIAVVLINL